MKQHKKLYWLEYTDVGPLYATRPFQAVGFETKSNGWEPNDSHRLKKCIYPELEKWQPDIVVFWMTNGYFEQFIEEPYEWEIACQFIRTRPELQHTKIMAFLGFSEYTPEQAKIWQERYDFYTLWPLKIIEHTKIAKQLAGEMVKGIEGTNFCLHRFGNWNIQNKLLLEQGSRGAFHPDAEGHFNIAPITRLMVADIETGYTWAPNGIQTHKPTYIVYIIKSKSEWFKGLSKAEEEVLGRLANGVASTHQLLVGANDILLQTNLKAISQVIKQVAQVGGWQIFLNEHLWFEGAFPAQGIEQILYDSQLAWPISM